MIFLYIWKLIFFFRYITTSVLHKYFFDTMSTDNQHLLDNVNEPNPNFHGAVKNDNFEDNKDDVPDVTYRGVAENEEKKEIVSASIPILNEQSRLLSPSTISPSPQLQYG